MGAGCGQRRMNLAALYFSSPCPPSRESCVKASFQMLFIDRLAKVADDPIGQGADPVNIIGVGSHQDCRNHAPTALWRCARVRRRHRSHLGRDPKPGGVAAAILMPQPRQQNGLPNAALWDGCRCLLYPLSGHASAKRALELRSNPINQRGTITRRA